MKNKLKSLVALSTLALAAACESPEAPEPEQILLYCDAQTREPVTVTLSDGGRETEMILSYRGFYRVDLEKETIEVQYPDNDTFLPLCSIDRPCKLTSNKSEIRFEEHMRKYRDALIDTTYVFERNTGHFSRTSETRGSGETETTVADGTCKPMNSVDQQIF